MTMSLILSRTDSVDRTTFPLARPRNDAGPASPLMGRGRSTDRHIAPRHDGERPAPMSWLFVALAPGEGASVIASLLLSFGPLFAFLITQPSAFASQPHLNSQPFPHCVLLRSAMMKALARARLPSCARKDRAMPSIAFTRSPLSAMS